MHYDVLLLSLALDLTAMAILTYAIYFHRHHRRDLTLGFMGVNMAALRCHGWHPVPAVGLLVCGFLWWKLSVAAKVVGGLWILVGALYGGLTGGFKRPLAAEIE